MLDAPYNRRFNPGSEIFREGDRGDYAYVIEQGHVEISMLLKGEKTVLKLLGPGDIFGEMALIDGAPRTATAAAVDQTLLTVITNEQITSRLQDSDPVLGLLLKVILERFRSGLKQQYLDSGTAPNVSSVEDVCSPVPHRGGAENLKLESELRRALQQREFVLYYQPIFDLNTGFVAGFETLIRWNHPERGLLSPYFFVKMAEQSSLIVPIGMWVLEEACRHQVLFRQVLRESDAGAAPLFMAINVSGREFTEADFADKLAAMLERTGADPKALKLEITENLLLNYEAALVWIEQCKGIGFTIALDDFGTGYSSLSCLHHFPIDTLKIDRSFVMTMLSDNRCMEIIRVMLRLARGLNMDVVAEGIEDTAELKALCNMYCNYGQGYLLSKPLDAASAMELLRGSRRLADFSA